MSEIYPTAEVANSVQAFLASKTSVVPDADFALARVAAPEEIKAAIAMYIEDVRSKLAGLGRFILTPGEDIAADEMAGLHEELSSKSNDLAAMEKLLINLTDQLGGDTRERVIETYKRFDYGKYWFREGLGPSDEIVIRDTLLKASQEFGVSVGHLNGLDFGTGDARIIELIDRLIESGLDPSNIDIFRKNIRGFDFVPSVAQGTLSKLTNAGFSRDSIFTGDFLKLSEEHQKEQYHFITAMMHTIWHCTTEAEWIRMLTTAEGAMRPGGFLIFDTVAIEAPPKNIECEVPDDIKDILQDEHLIKNVFQGMLTFYEILWRKYCSDKQPVIDQLFPSGISLSEDNTNIIHPKLIESPRQFIEDSTAGISGQSFTREIPTSNWVEELCKVSGIKLYPSEIRDRSNALQGDDMLLRMGLGWLASSKLEIWLKNEIRKRLLHVYDNKIAIDNELINKFYNMIALNIVKNYRNRYLIFRKR